MSGIEGDLFDFGAPVMGLQTTDGEVLAGYPIPGPNDVTTEDHSAIVGDDNLWDDLVNGLDTTTTTEDGNTNSGSTTNSGSSTAEPLTPHSGTVNSGSSTATEGSSNGDDVSGNNSGSFTN